MKKFFLYTFIVILPMTFVAPEAEAISWPWKSSKKNYRNRKKSPGILRRQASRARRYMSPCAMSNCKTIAGFRHCLKKAKIKGKRVYALYEDRPNLFYAIETNPEERSRTSMRNKFMKYKTRQPVFTLDGMPVLEEEYDPEESSDTDLDDLEQFNGMETEPVIRNVISVGAYTAYKKIVEANPNCFKAFCDNVCLMNISLDKSDMELDDDDDGSADEAAEAQKINMRKMTRLCLKRGRTGDEMRLFCSKCYEQEDAADRAIPACKLFDVNNEVNWNNTAEARKAAMKAALQDEADDEGIGSRLASEGSRRTSGVRGSLDSSLMF